MTELIRTDSDDPDFRRLIKLLDALLEEKDGEEHSYYKQFNKSGSIRNVLIAYEDNIAVGCGALRKYSGDIAEIKRMFVTDESRGKGIGKMILSGLEEWAAELGFSGCILETGKRQTEAVGLYLKSGYAVIPNYGQYENMDNSICMKKTIRQKIQNIKTMKFKTADLCDQYADKVRVARSGAQLKNYGGQKIFSGIIETVKCFENNPLVRKALEKDGTGKVLVVDGGGSGKVALFGDMLAETGIRNNWNGIVINGCIRDSAEVSTMNLGIMALGTNPLKSGKKEEGKYNFPVSFAGLRFIPGEHIYCDEDGIIVSAENLIDKS